MNYIKYKKYENSNLGLKELEVRLTRYKIVLRDV